MGEAEEAEAVAHRERAEATEAAEAAHKERQEAEEAAAAADKALQTANQAGPLPPPHRSAMSSRLEIASRRDFNRLPQGRVGPPRPAPPRARLRVGVDGGQMSESVHIG
eukprot:COSAG01_NODE_1191_length_11314_cov_59.567722_16_plen_109_part_00